MGDGGPSRRLLGRVGVRAAVCWLAASTALSVSRERAGRPDVSEFASTASGVAHGRAWTLVTSMLPVSRYPFAELAGCTVTVVAALSLLGGVRFWIVALGSHVGSTLLVYAGLGAAWVLAPSAVSDLVAEEDYGISAVWLGAVGAIAVAVHRRGLRRTAVIMAGTAVAASLALLLAFSEELALAEHLVALAIGAAMAWALLPAVDPVPQADEPRPRDDARPTPSAGTCPSARMAASPVRARLSDPS